jgi:hypothetical protein
VDENELLVTIVLVGEKRRNRLMVAGEEFSEHHGCGPLARTPIEKQARFAAADTTKEFAQFIFARAEVRREKRGKPYLASVDRPPTKLGPAPPHS